MKVADNFQGLFTTAVVSKRADSTFTLYLENFRDLGILKFDLDNLTLNASGEWSNYVKGVLSILIEKGYRIPFGLNIVVYGNLPNGTGLSSSASLELLMCKVFDTFYNLKVIPTDMALIGKQTENERVIIATKCIENNDIIGFGKLLSASHHSLQYDYEVTGIELDTLVYAALDAGAIGARMTGAGFGRCVISLVKTNEVDSFIPKVGIHYEKTIGYAASFYNATIGDGPIQFA